MKRRKNTRRLKLGRVFIVLFAFVFIIWIVSRIIFGGKVKSGQSSFELNINTTAILIRDEKSFYLGADDEEFARIEYNIQEGESVEKGQEVATTYKLGFSDEVFQKLYNIQQEIYDEQMSLLSGISTPEIQTVQEEIDSLVEELRLVHENYADVQKSVKEIESELSEALLKRNSLLYRMVQPSERLSSLYKEEQTRLEQIKNWTSRIIASESGVFSSYSDGNELSLRLDKKDRITATQLKEVLGEKGYDASMGENDLGFMYRIIDDSRFAIGVALDNKEMPRIYSGQKYNVTFGNLTTYEGVCTIHKCSSEGFVAIIEFDQKVGDFMTMRTVDVNIRSAFSGVRLNKSAIKVDKSGAVFVKPAENGNKSKIYVDVLAKNGKYVIIKASNESEAVYEGQHFVVLNLINRLFG